MVARGVEGVGGLGGKRGGTEEHRLAVIRQSGDVKHSTGNTVTNIAIAMYGVRWVPDSLGGITS